MLTYPEELTLALLQCMRNITAGLHLQQLDGTLTLDNLVRAPPARDLLLFVIYMLLTHSTDNRMSWLAHPKEDLNSQTPSKYPRDHWSSRWSNNIARAAYVGQNFPQHTAQRHGGYYTTVRGRIGNGKKQMKSEPIIINEHGLANVKLLMATTMACETFKPFSNVLLLTKLNRPPWCRLCFEKTLHAWACKHWRAVADGHWDQHRHPLYTRGD
jgi:hypothetical protein